jgi:hypothetical protein
MGDSTSWVAVRGKSGQLIREQFQLKDSLSAEYEQFAEGAELAGGWYLIIGRYECFDTFGADFEEKLSANAEAIFCSVESHVMCSSASGWMNGKKIWSVEHCPELEIEELEEYGNLPEPYASIRDKALKQQEEEDASNERAVDYIYDVPPNLVKELTGFDYNKGASTKVFKQLWRPKPQKKSFFRSLFG